MRRRHPAHLLHHGAGEQARPAQLSDQPELIRRSPDGKCWRTCHWPGYPSEQQLAQKSAFDFHVRDHVPVPAPGGGTWHDDDRLVYSLDGMAIAEIAPRAMAAAVAKALGESGLAGGDVNFVVPHQAGTGIVRFTEMQLEGLGIRGELVNGLTRRTGNVSACSVPHVLKETWSRLTGLVACPTAAVGSPGRPEVLQGCVLLRSTALHDRQATVAA